MSTSSYDPARSITRTDRRATLLIERSAVASSSGRERVATVDARSAAKTAKRVFDIAVAATALILLAPLVACVSLAILLDTGRPIFFRQRRVGQYGRLFDIWKFRTMVPDRRTRNVGPPAGLAERRRAHKSAGDPRLTRVGRFLRRTCLDEIPQFWNALRGDMSIVGPRPELPEIVEQYEDWQHARHLVTPGITGWWQVNRDARIPMHRASQLDLYYVEHWSLWLDLVILVRTIGVVFRGVGAF
jgi:lipopolysaccharide/colanic/teichoic acid biosynthesis glycosyltransferase